MSFDLMEEKVEKPCWNITAWALAAFFLFVCAIALMTGSGAEMASVDQTPIS